jgi:hypothetical protein
MTACRPPVFPFIKRILCFRVPESVMFNPDSFFKSNYYEVITANQIAKKASAFCCYKSEIRGSDHPRSDYWIIKIAEYYGLKIHESFSEAFEVLRWIN